MLALVILAIAAVIYFALIDQPNERKDSIEWVTYRNSEHGYEIQYPKGWELTEEPTKCDSDDPPFCVQEIALRDVGESEVYVFVNFQGGWCENLPNPQISDIVVSQHFGKEYRCPGFTIRDFGDGISLIRFFPEIDRKNFLILGQGKLDLAEVILVIETFAFVE
jgi:hypothetical protein